MPRNSLKLFEKRVLPQGQKFRLGPILRRRLDDKPLDLMRAKYSRVNIHESERDESKSLDGNFAPLEK